MDAITLMNRLMARGKFRHFQALTKLNDLRNMGRAAEAIGITQPAMSQLVADMEALLEIKLFFRHARGVEPTPIAVALIEVAGRALRVVEDGVEVLAAHIEGSTHFVRVAATTSTLENFVAQSLPEFNLVHPEIHVQVDERGGQPLEASFTSGEYDMVCCLKKEVLPDGWEFIPCLNDRLVAVCSTESSLAALQNASPEELGQATWLPNHARTASRRGFEYLRAKHNWQNVKTVNLSTRSATATLALLRARDLATVLPRSLAARWIEQGLAVELPVDIEIPHWQLGIHWHPKSASPAALKLVKALQRAAQARNDQKVRRAL
jgi:DNA-binding transcriptional LysR family regulator